MISCARTHGLKHSAKTKNGSKRSIHYTETQQHVLTAIQEKPIVIVQGPAGVGKTKCAIDAGVKMLTEDQIRKIIITRPAVSVEEDHGFLPGSLEDKMKPWLMPIYDAFGQHFQTQELASLMRNNVIEISPLAYMRGRTFRDSFILCDESQNCTVKQMKMVLTRIGHGSRMVIAGDPNQDDLIFKNDHDQNGLVDLVNRLLEKGVPDRVGLVSFDRSEIVRHDAIKDVLNLYE